MADVPTEITISSAVADHLTGSSQLPKPVVVSLSRELVRLLSEQLYQSPIKAIEELVTNAFDAEAKECRIRIQISENPAFLAVYDDGTGMTAEGLSNLWQIGYSNKRKNEIARRAERKQIGKFGIGKLATYTIANRLTHISRTENRILAVTVDFRQFESSTTGGVEVPIEVPVWEITDFEEFSRDSGLSRVITELGLQCGDLVKTDETWTIALLEDLKPKTQTISIGRLKWVLSTAMPLRSDFRIYLNLDRVESSKESYKPVVSFKIAELEPKRLEDLAEVTGETWEVVEGALVSPSFPSGISGEVLVTEKILEGKSDDLGRSYGFFIYVRERLVNEDDALFGLTALVYGPFHRFNAMVYADDLDAGIKASRETIEDSDQKRRFRDLLRAIFNQALTRYTEKTTVVPTTGTKEGDLAAVPPRLVAEPIADVIMMDRTADSGSEPDNTWFYFQRPLPEEVDSLVQRFYTEYSQFKYDYTNRGQTSRVVTFDPVTSTFTLNQDHELVREYVTEGRAKTLLEDLVTAEVLLEVYLRESHIDPQIIGDVLEKRDALLRSLVKDHIYSPSMVAKTLRDSTSSAYELEVALVAAARALGFVAQHKSGGDEPDGVARFAEYPGGEKVITLEAKSSQDIPSLGHFDFGGLFEHMKVDYRADGCLLIAPGYPGMTKGDGSAVANRAQLFSEVSKKGISCWTVEQLATFVEAAEKRHLNAKHVLDIALNKYSPSEVTAALDALLNRDTKDNPALYRSILKSLRRLEGRLKDSQRSVGMIAGRVLDDPEFEDVLVADVEEAVRVLANASQGGMIVSGDNVLLYVSLDELERRLSNLTRFAGRPQTLSNFRNYDSN